MNMILLRKSFYEARWLLAGCSAALISMGWVFVWAVSQLDTSRFRQLLDLLPGNLKRFTTVDFEWMITYPGRISMLFDEPMVVLVMAVFCIARGSDCVSGELGRGTLEMLISQPVSRLQVLLANWSVTLLGIVVLALALWLGIYLGVQTNSVKEEILPTFQVPLVGWEFPVPFAEATEKISPMSEKVDVTVFIPAVLNFFCLGVFIAGLTALLSSLDRYRWRTIGIVCAIYVVSALVKIAGMASPKMAWLLWLSFFSAYEPEAFVSQSMEDRSAAWQFVASDVPDASVPVASVPDANATETAEVASAFMLGPLGYDLVLLSLGLLAHAAAAVVFCRRDIPAPL